MDTPEGVIVAIVLSAVSGGGGVKFLEFLWDKHKGRTEARRAEVDRAAKIAATAEAKLENAQERISVLARENRLLMESLHDHRTAMQESGHWTRESLPPWIKE